MTLAKSTNAPCVKHDTCINRYSWSFVMSIMTIDNFRSQHSAPFNDFAFNFNDINYFSVNRFLKTLTVN